MTLSGLTNYSQEVPTQLCIVRTLHVVLISPIYQAVSWRSNRDHAYYQLPFSVYKLGKQTVQTALLSLIGTEHGHFVCAKLADFSEQRLERTSLQSFHGEEENKQDIQWFHTCMKNDGCSRYYRDEDTVNAYLARYIFGKWEMENLSSRGINSAIGWKLPALF